MPTMALQWVIFVCFLFISMMQYHTISAAKNMDIYCGACKAIIDEVEYSISKIDPRKMIDVGSFRLDPRGKTKSVKVPLARSEGHLTELLEKVCDDVSSDYVETKDKKSGRTRLKRMVTHDGKMSSDVDFSALMKNAQESGDKPPDTDSKKVKFICEGIIEEYEEDFVKLLAKSDKDIAFKVCTEIGEYCDANDTQESEEAKDEL